MTQHFNHHPQRFPSTTTKATRLRPLHLLPPDTFDDLPQDELIAPPATTPAEESARAGAATIHAEHQIRKPSRPRKRTLKIRHQIALGATCSLLLLTFISIAHYEQGKANPVISNTGASYQPTQTEASTPRTQQTVLSPTHVPSMKAQEPIPTTIPAQVTSTSVPVQTASTPLPAQTTTPASKQLTKSAYISIARSDATKVGINPDYFVKQIQLESGFNPDAQGPAGATGIAQFMPATATGLGIDPTDPLASLNAAAQMMANYSHQFGNDYAKALAAYNLGSESVQEAVQAGGANWLAQVPESTQNYIHEVMG